jgi:glycosyltransferase involved in cell wall biosynthesis
MKVIHYWPHLFYLESSGPGNSILGWARSLARLGVETTLVGDETAVRMTPPKDLDYVFVRHVGRGSFRVPLRLPISEQEESLLVTHGGWTFTNVVAGWHARRRSVPYMVMPHAVYDPQVLRRRAVLKKVWFSTLEKPYLERAAAIHMFFSDERQHLASLRVSSPTVVAPNGIEPLEGVRWDGGSGGYVLWLGRYDPVHKGLDILLHGLSLMSASQRPRLRLHGRDYHGGRQVVERLCHELNLEGFVSVGDPIYGDEKWRLMAEAVGFVHPSRWEGSSIAVAEAISIGTPTMVAGYAMGRFLASRGGAILVDLTPSGVRQGIEQLLSDEAKETGARGSEIARRELSWDAVARSWVMQVESILADRKR